MRINSGLVIDVGGAFTYGLTIIIPQVQLTSIPRSQTNQLENIDLVGIVMDDLTNPAVIALAYTGQAAYLA